LDDQFHVPTNAIVGGFITAAITVLGWIIKIAARETLRGFKDSLAVHTAAIEKLTETVDEHRKELAEVRVVQADFAARLKTIEHMLP
jgi:hypothetical protein